MGLSIAFFIGLISTPHEFRFIIYVALFAGCVAVVAIDLIPTI